MKVGDLVRYRYDGLENVGIACRETLASDGYFFVQFPNTQHINGWYSIEELEVISESRRFSKI